MRLDIQYVGDAGVTQQSIDAILRQLQYGGRVVEARLLSSKNEHALTLRTDGGEVIAVRAGFTSGYQGEGPRGLSTVLRVLRSFGIDVIEREVPPAFLKRLNECRLSERDLREILAPAPVFGGGVYKYMDSGHSFASDGEAVTHVFEPVVPFGALDPRLVDLATTFWDDPDDRLMKGYRRLEGAVRTRTGLENSAKMSFSKVVRSLRWPHISDEENGARSQLFASAYAALRNPRAHRELSHARGDQLAEFMTLNMLFRLEARAEAGEAASA